MKIRKIDTTNKRDVRKFIDFPNQLYKGNLYFCPSLETEVRFALNRVKHPFYTHSFADFFLAESEGDVVGRISAIHNTLHNEYRQVSTAFFWSFDSIEDFQTAQRLFEAVFDWARQRKRNTILGPRGLIGSDASGVLVEGFEQRAVMGVPYNYPYYDGFIQQMGFNKLTDHWSGYLPVKFTLPKRFYDIAERVKQRRGFSIKSFSSKEEMRSWAPLVLSVHKEAFSGSHEWHPNTDEEMWMVANSLIDIADPRLIKLVMKGDRVIGFALVYQDLSDALRKANGHLLPFGWWHFQRERRRTKWLLCNGVGVLPAYQNLGGNAVLYTELLRTVQELQLYEHADIVQVNEINFTSRSDMESLGVKWYKKHRSYTREL